MKIKAIAVVAVIGLAVVLAMAFRTNSRADAAAGNCYAALKGPSQPVICS